MLWDEGLWVMISPPYHTRRPSRNQEMLAVVFWPPWNMALGSIERIPETAKPLLLSSHVHYVSALFSLVLLLFLLILSSPHLSPIFASLLYTSIVPHCLAGLHTVRCSLLQTEVINQVVRNWPRHHLQRGKDWARSPERSIRAPD